jgi:hypothetical protein
MEKKKQTDILNYMLMKRGKDIADKLKVEILNKLIEVSEKRDGILLKEELEFIRNGIEEQRNKEKEKELKSIANVINTLVGRFDNLDKQKGGLNSSQP